MIKYIGSKRLLVPRIVELIGSLGDVRSVVDFFSGTSRVGMGLKAAGYQVMANDVLRFAHVVATCYIQADAESHAGAAGRLVRELNRLPGRPGYFTETFCERSRFVHPRNGERVDAMREWIANRDLEPVLEAVALTALMEAADRVDSTTGVQMAYLKQWAPRALNPIELRVPELLPRARHGRGRATCLEAREAADELVADVAYIDPPYNQHSYLGNYHLWESLVRWDKPATYGRACKRVDCQTRKSDFNSRQRAALALEEFLARVRCRYLVVSFSNEGFFARESIEALLAGRGLVETHVVDHKRYVGAQIGIYNPAGQKVGRVSHLRNHEYLFVVRPRVESRRAVVAAGTRASRPIPH